MDDALLSVEDLHVEVGGKEVLAGVDLRIGSGEVHALFGPNGSGKTTLISAILGFEGYRITRGRILFRGEEITSLPTHERAKLGLGISFQRPPAVRGVRLRQLVELCARKDGKLLEEYARKLNLLEHLDREVNVGFSGGEMKRAELLQLLLQDPVMVFLDEPESGVDLENIALIGRAINHLLGRRVEPEADKPIKEVLRQRRKSALIITHTGHILDYVEADQGHVILDGRLICRGNPREILHTIKEHGYEECFRCFRRAE
ncbi:MAG: ABC transporter ATP-binding protein [Deltaproteobacteria bacterium]|nr:MAG: ABC transporter ATP-binding protein [Deltaproteobacteria bacterium]